MVLALAAPACGWGGSDEPGGSATTDATAPTPQTEDVLPPHERLCDLGRDNDQGVAGHDLAASTRLPDGSALFAFGDTYLGTVDGDVRTTTGLLNQSAAIIPAGEGICSDQIRYLTGADGQVRDLLPPPAVDGTVYWPVDLAVHDDQVWMLFRWVRRTGDGVLDLETLGTGLAVADPDDLEFHPLLRLLEDDGRPLPTALVGTDDGLVTLVCGEGGSTTCRLHAVDTEQARIGEALDAPPVDLAFAEMGLGRVEVDGRERWRVSALPTSCGTLQVAVLGDDGWDVEPVLDTESQAGGACYAGRVQEAFSDAEELDATWVESPERRSDGDVYWPHVDRIDLDGG